MTVDRHDEPTAMQRQRSRRGEARARAAELRRAAAETSADGGARGTRRHRSQGGGLGELSQMQQHRLGSEAHDGDGGDVGETAARVATVTMKLKVA